MDIKERIDALTEQEAEAALYYLLEANAKSLALQYGRKVNMYMSNILDEVLKETQHEHKRKD